MAQATMMPHGERMQSFRLLSGRAMPGVGLGTWKSGSQAEDNVYTAIVEVTFYFYYYHHHIWVVILFIVVAFWSLNTPAMKIYM